MARPSSPTVLGGRAQPLSGRPGLVEVVAAQARHHERPQERWLELHTEVDRQLDGAVLDLIQPL